MLYLCANFKNRLKMKLDMKLKTTWSIMMLMLIFFVACSDDNTVTEEPTPIDPVEEPVKTATEVLEGIQGVSDIKEAKDANKNDIVTFYFEQPIDHTNPAAGTFKQYCVLHYKGPNEVTVLHTQGYSTGEPDKIKQPGLTTNLNGNYLEVEHRYYKHSAINKDADYYNPNYWTYNTAAQSTADLHDVVTALKNTGCFKGKWVSTGVSKNGILTALYAYYYPNEMDVYVPFCAPFCDAAESTGIGEYLVKECGKGTELQKRVWEVLGEMATNEKLRTEMTECYKRDKPNVAMIQRYTDTQAMCELVARYMSSMFDKFCYHPTDEWDNVIPTKDSNAEIYYQFCMMNQPDFYKRLNTLRTLWDFEIAEEVDQYEYDEFDEYELDDEDQWQYGEEDVESASTRSRRAQKMTFEQLLPVIYHVHAAKELGYFVFDWSVLPANHVLPESNLKWLKKYYSVTSYNKTYGVTYDGGKLTKDFFEFLKNNRNKDKCKMFFIYGANDPWTGAAIPDPAADDPYIIKHIVPKGVHSGWLNSPSHYTAQERDYIMNTVREMLK